MCVPPGWAPRGFLSLAEAGALLRRTQCAALGLDVSKTAIGLALTLGTTASGLNHAPVLPVKTFVPSASSQENTKALPGEEPLDARPSYVNIPPLQLLIFELSFDGRDAPGTRSQERRRAPRRRLATREIWCVL